MKPDSLTVTQTVIGKGWAKGAVWQLRVDPRGYVRFDCICEGAWGKKEASGTTISKNKWSHIAATYDRSYKRVYVNGFSAMPVRETRTMDLTNDNIVIGAWMSAIREPFSGVIDEVKIYNKAFNPAKEVVVKSDIL